MKLTSLEQAALLKTIESESFHLSKGDVSQAPVLSREFTGRSFFTEIQPGSIGVIPYIHSFTGGNVGAILNNSIHAGFLIYINDGCIVTIEGFTYEEEWPKEITSFEFYLAKKIT